MKVSVVTLGCKANQAEGYNIEKVLHKAGYKIVSISEEPDICIINTCSVTSRADKESRQLINKYLNKNIRVIVTGCYSEINRDKIKELYPSIEILRNDSKLEILRLIKPLDNVITTSYYHPRQRPAVKIQDGCNNSCAYCIIPSTRGNSRSVNPDKIIDEIVEYESIGYKEVVLTGIHIGAYGTDLIPQFLLSKILNFILRKTCTIRIRLSSLEITDINNELLDVLSDSRICKHLHIPLQSGDDNILFAMNRRYKAKDYIKIIDKILYLYNDIALGTDVIVGFPGENEAAFNNTKALLDELPFSYMHIFAFSRRPNTIASKLPLQIDENTKKIRSKILRNIGEKKRREFITKNIGNIKKVIIENQNSQGFIGTSEDYIKVLIPNNNNLREGLSIDVIIIGYKKNFAIGTPIN